MKNNVMYFGYGKENFGYDKELGNSLEVNFNKVEGAGIALIKGKHIDVFPHQLNLKITNNSDNKTMVRIEKKFYNDVKTGFHLILPKSDECTTVSFDGKEQKELKELVVAVLHEDNLGIDSTSISLHIN